MRVLIATVQVPFIHGGAELLAEGLLNALRAEGHQADIVAVPFKWYPPERIIDHMLACRLLDLTESAGTSIDRVIGLKFPAYLISHPNKVLWIVHQHRTAYDLWDNPIGDLINAPNGLEVRDAIRQADTNLIPEAKAIFTIAGNVSKRLKKYNGINSTPLYNPPPNAKQFYSAEGGDYFFFPSRLTALKRQALALEALAQTSRPVRIGFAGAPDEPAYGEWLKTAARKYGVQRRVEWLGQVSEDEKVRLYANSLGVIYPPLDEDYGYVTLEAMLSSKPLITCEDSGGPLEFLRNKETGLIAEPTPKSIAAAMGELYENRELARRMGRAARDHYDSMDISWRNVVKELMA